MGKNEKEPQKNLIQELTNSSTNLNKSNQNDDNNGLNFEMINLSKENDSDDELKFNSLNYYLTSTNASLGLYPPTSSSIINNGIIICPNDNGNGEICELHQYANDNPNSNNQFFYYYGKLGSDDMKTNFQSNKFNNINNNNNNNNNNNSFNELKDGNSTDPPELQKNQSNNSIGNSTTTIIETEQETNKRKIKSILISCIPLLTIIIIIVLIFIFNRNIIFT